jgi:hypothetical protein
MVDDTTLGTVVLGLDGFALRTAELVEGVSMATGISGWAVSWDPGWWPSDLRVDGHVISGCAVS